MVQKANKRLGWASYRLTSSPQVKPRNFGIKPTNCPVAAGTADFEGKKPEFTNF